jgi:hypothetical protein
MGEATEGRRTGPDSNELSDAAVAGGDRESSCSEKTSSANEGRSDLDEDGVTTVSAGVVGDGTAGDDGVTGGLSGASRVSVGIATSCCSCAGLCVTKEMGSGTVSAMSGLAKTTGSETTTGDSADTLTLELESTSGS